MSKFLALSEPRLPFAVESICKLLAKGEGLPDFVGGSLNDALLNIPVADFDIEVFMLAFGDIRLILELEFRSTVQRCRLQNSRSFGVIKISNFRVDISVPKEEI
jgi:tRNA nucleotidyltransferase/poly(A) polymerase